MDSLVFPQFLSVLAVYILHSLTAPYHCNCSMTENIVIILRIFFACSLKSTTKDAEPQDAYHTSNNLHPLNRESEH